jgi:energy-coupling factor transporter ATP-binding protein EcfA2
MPPLVIGLLGPAGAGKSTVANHLVKYGAKKYSLAAPLKEIARRTLNFTDAQLHGTQVEKETIDERYNFSPRWFLQKLGTEGIRGVLGDDFWTMVCLNRIIKDNPRLAVIEDMRFINESEALRYHPHLNGHVWRLHPPADEESSKRASAAGTHASETEWRTAFADTDIKPLRRDVGLLLEAVDACYARLATVKR